MHEDVVDFLMQHVVVGMILKEEEQLVVDISIFKCLVDLSVVRCVEIT